MRQASQSRVRLSGRALAQFHRARSPRASGLQGLVRRSPSRAAEQLHRDDGLPRTADDSAGAARHLSAAARARAGSGSAARRSCWRACSVRRSLRRGRETAGLQVLRAGARGSAAAAADRLSRGGGNAAACAGPLIAACLAMLIAYDLALVAGRFYPYLEPKHADVPVDADGRSSCATIARRSASRRSSTTSGRTPRRWSASRTCAVTSARSAIIGACCCVSIRRRGAGRRRCCTFNSLKYNFDDPLNALLGIRWFIEHKQIDIIKWGIFGRRCRA